MHRRAAEGLEKPCQIIQHCTGGISQKQHEKKQNTHYLNAQLNEKEENPAAIYKLDKLCINFNT
jgi:hypothetical protein